MRLSTAQVTVRGLAGSHRPLYDVIRDANYITWEGTIDD
jgi:hypothetical protein